MLTYLRRLTDERDSLTQAATDLTEKAASDERDLTDTEQVSLRGWQERCATIDAQLTEYNAQAESQRAYARLRDELHHDDDDDGDRTPARLQTRSVERAQGWGDAFVESDAFRNYNGRGSSGTVELPGGVLPIETREAVGLETRAAITTADGPVVPYLYTPPARAVASPLIDVCGHLNAGSNAVSWVQWTPNPPSAAPVVPEGTDKPEATMTATPTSDTLDTYAHWKEITRQALEDIPQIRSIVETRLRQGVMRAIESAVASSLAAAPIPDVTIPTGGTLLAAIRSGLATVQTAGYTPNAVLLNPMDAADIDLGVMGGTLLGPTRTASYWGLRPIASPDIPAGTAYVGDFQTAVVIFDRGTTSVYLTDSHADNFIKNVLLLLAEVRALVTVPSPDAAAACTVSPVARASGSAGK